MLLNLVPPVAVPALVPAIAAESRTVVVEVDRRVHCRFPSGQLTVPVTASLDDCGCEIVDGGELGCCELDSEPGEEKLDADEPQAASIITVTADTPNAVR
jgi:hypothetical protein